MTVQALKRIQVIRCIIYNIDNFSNVEHFVLEQFHDSACFQHARKKFQTAQAEWGILGKLSRVTNSWMTIKARLWNRKRYLPCKLVELVTPLLTRRRERGGFWNDPASLRGLPFHAQTGEMNLNRCPRVPQNPWAAFVQKFHRRTTFVDSGRRWTEARHWSVLHRGSPCPRTGRESN